MIGYEMSAEDADKIEKQLEITPFDIQLRSALIEYYWFNKFKSEDCKNKHQEHVFWLIQNAPDAPFAGMPQTTFEPLFYSTTVHEQAKDLWLKSIWSDPKNIDVLCNAARFFILVDKELSEDLFKRVQKIDPENIKANEGLAVLHSLQIGDSKSKEEMKESAMAKLDEIESSYIATERDKDDIFLLKILIKTAFQAGNILKTEKYAREMLKKGMESKSKNIQGMSIHHGNKFLGMTALANGDIEKAKGFLIEAGNTPGSATLGSFGPNMALAKGLLEVGETKTVIEYFKQCSVFWKSGKKKLVKWTKIVESGKIPDFGANLDY